MDKKMVRSILLIITYAVGLVLVLLKFDDLGGLAQNVLGIFRPLFIGFAIAFVLNRPCRFFDRLYSRALRKHKAPGLARGLAVVTSYLVLILAISAIFSFVLPKLSDSIQLFINSMGGYIVNLQSWANELMAKFHLDTLDLSGLSSTLRKMLETTFNAITNAAPQVLAFTSSIISAVVTLVLAIVFSIYMLSGQEKLLRQCRRVLRAYVPQKPADAITDVVHLTAATFTRFVTGQLVEACILGGLCALGMLFIQADYAPLIGVVIATSALIPVAGAYLGAILSAFLLVMVNPVKALIFIIFLLILQQIEGNVIYPRVVGTSIGLPGIWVLTAVTVGGGLMGLLGVLVSVPIASVLYTLLRRNVHKRLGEPI